MQSPFILYGKSGKKYEFHSICPISTLPNLKFQKDFGIIYVYLHIYSNENIRLIYCGKDENPPKRFREHEENDKNIISKSNFVAICHYLYLKDMENDEIDLIKGNPFEENIQHNS